MPIGPLCHLAGAGVILPAVHRLIEHAFLEVTGPSRPVVSSAGLCPGGIGAMVTHLLLSKEILPAGSMLEAAQWTLAVLSLVAAIVSIIDTMVDAVGPAGDAVGPSISGIVLFVVLTVLGMAAIVLAAMAYDAHKRRKMQAQ